MKSKNTKLVKLQKEEFPKGYHIFLSDNGFQWSSVFRGSLKDARKVLKAYKSVGYKLTKQKMGQYSM